VDQEDWDGGVRERWCGKRIRDEVRLSKKGAMKIALSKKEVLKISKCWEFVVPCTSRM